MVQFHEENLTFTGEENPMRTLLLHVMGAIVRFERALIRERQREGITASKTKGERGGAKPKLTNDQVEEIRKHVAGGVFKSDLAREYGVSRQTLYASLKAAGV